MKRYFSLILAIAATVSAQIVPSTGNVRGPTSATDNAVARYDGTTGKLVQNSAVTIDDSGNTTAADVILGTSGPSVKSTLSARAPRQGLVFDGTAGATVSVPALGTTYTIAAWVNPANVSGAKVVVATAGQNPLYLSGADVYSAGGSAGLTVASGKTQLVVLSVSAGTVTPYLNAIAGSPYVDATSITALVAIGSNSTGTTYPWNGTLSVLIYNRALSASEVVALYEAGAPSSADYNSASNTAVYSTDFSTSTGWTTETGWSITGGVAVLSGSNVGALYRSAASSLKQGSRYRITFTVASYVSGGVRPWIQIGSSRVLGTARTANGTYTEEIIAPSATGLSYVGIEASTSAACSLNVDDYSYFNSGLLLAPDAAQAGNGLVWTDLSGNGAHVILPTSGVSWNVKGTGAIRVRGATYTNGNQLLLGAATVPVGYRILSIAARLQTGGSPNVTLGSSSGASDYASSTAITSTSWKYIPVASGGEITTTTNFWVGSSSTAVVYWDITAQPLDF